ncbi:MAG: HEAT repeat domain-containing protein, partial [Candidatus Saelkia tenebricola]|nr:HEAT repeat domain-containing protein [Candidatus Saelkia tenebricola]
REGIVEALGYIGHIRGVEPVLDRVLNDLNEEVRIRAAESLGLIGEESTLGTLREVAVNDISMWVRNAAEEAIYKIEEKENIGMEYDDKDTVSFLQYLENELVFNNINYNIDLETSFTDIYLPENGLLDWDF